MRFLALLAVSGVECAVIKSTDDKKREKRIKPKPDLATRLALTIPEACEVLAVSRTTFWRLTQEGVISPFELHGCKLVRRVDLEALVDEKAQAARRRKGITLDAAAE